MDKTIRGSWLTSGCRCNLDVIPIIIPDRGSGIRTSASTDGRESIDGGNGYNASSIMQGRSGERGAKSMKWIRTFIDIWSGDFWKEERERSREVLEDTRRVINESRAMLDGEDDWLIPLERRRRYCDYPKK